MPEPQTTTNILSLRLWQRFWEIAVLYWFSEEKWKARGLLLLVLLMLAGAVATGLVLTYVQGNMTTALQTRNLPEFYHAILLFFGGIVVCIPISVYSGYLPGKLKLHWELWLTNHFLEKYFKNRVFYHINDDRSIDNPDQRIASDVASFTATSIGFINILFFNIVSFFTYAGVLWNITPHLLTAVLAYAAFGTLVTAVLGKPLINLNFQQLRREADFRYSLVQIRDNVESIAFYRGEERENTQVRQRLHNLIGNFRMLIGWERNLSFFTTGYTYVVLLVPIAVLAPSFFAGQIKFGVFTVAGIAFTSVLSSFDIIVKYFSMFSSFAAEITRLETFDRALDHPQGGSIGAGIPTIASREEPRLALHNVTLRTPDYRQTLMRDATMEVPAGTGLLIAGGSGLGKSSLLRALAGLWNAGDGEISRPPLAEMLFLPQRPYMILGSLREQLLYPNLEQQASDQELHAVLKKVNLENLAERFDGFATVMNWGQILSPGEQQRLAFARLLISRPGYAVLDEATSALDVQNEARLYRQLQESGTTYVSVGHRPSLLAYHDQVLELQGEGNWRLMTAAEFQLATTL